jgi:DNA-directed RNA polymerase subunit beta
LPERLRGETAAFEIATSADKVIVEVGRRITAKHIREIEKSGIKELDIPADYLHGKVIAKTFASCQPMNWCVNVIR